MLAVPAYQQSQPLHSVSRSTRSGSIEPEIRATTVIVLAESGPTEVRQVEDDMLGHRPRVAEHEFYHRHCSEARLEQPISPLKR